MEMLASSSSSAKPIYLLRLGEGAFVFYDIGVYMLVSSLRFCTLQNRCSYEQLQFYSIMNRGQMQGLAS